MTARRAAGLTAAYYAVLFATLGAHLPYWPVWLKAWGLDEADIGLFLGAATVARIIGSTLVPALADRYAIRRRIIMLASLASAGLFLAHLLVETQGVLLAATLILAIFMAPTIPLGEALGLRAAGAFGFDYAVVRAAGSVGFLLANVGIGWALDRAHPDLIVWFIFGGFLVIAALGAIHPGGGAAAESDQSRYAEIGYLLRKPAFAVFLVAVALGQSSHMVYYVYSVLAWREQGMEGALIGWLWAFGVIVETALMLGPGRGIVAAIGPAAALAVGAGAAVLRWGCMALTPEVGFLWPLQGLHALTFALAHLGAMAFLAQAVPPRLAGSAQGLLSGVAVGLTSAAAMAGAALLVELEGVASAYLLMAGLGAASLAAALVLWRLWSGRPLLE